MMSGSFSSKPASVSSSICSSTISLSAVSSSAVIEESSKEQIDVRGRNCSYSLLSSGCPNAEDVKKLKEELASVRLENQSYNDRLDIVW